MRTNRLRFILFHALLFCFFSAPALGMDAAAFKAEAERYSRGKTKPDAFIAVCAQAIAAAGEDVAYKSQAHVWRGKARLARKEYFLASDDARTACRLEPASPDGYELMAAIYEQQGMYDKASQELYKGAKLLKDAFARNKMQVRAEELRKKAERGDGPPGRLRAAPFEF